MNMRKLNLFIKRCEDILLSLLALVVLSPLMLLVSFLIVIDSRGFPLFLQERVGKNRKIFKIIKFRTMKKNAESIGSGVFTSQNDPRVTRIGHMLRRTSFDEFPQLINVLIGQMSLVGPRPPVTYHPYHFYDYPAKYVARFTMKPGITGYAQVKGRNTLTWEERLELDNQYIERFNTFLDVVILFKTILVFANKNGLYCIDNRRSSKNHV